MEPGWRDLLSAPALGTILAILLSGGLAGFTLRGILAPPQRRDSHARAVEADPASYSSKTCSRRDSHARAMEAERDRATALLRTFVETVPGVIYAKDRDGRLLIGNSGVAMLIGKAPEAFIGKTDAELLDDPAQAAMVMANDRRIMESGIPEQIEEAVNLPDGTPRIWLSTKAPLRDESGQVIGLVGASLDITDRKAAEAVLSRGRADLEHLVEERTRDLKVTQERLAHAQRMEALGQLAGGIAHDFNNVLQSVQGGARLIEARAEENEKILRLARMVAEAAERGSSITRRLLAFSRRRALRAEAVSPASLLDDLREIFAHTLGGGVVVEVQAGLSLPPMLADKGQLETVLINLATNARDAMPSGGVLTLEASFEIVAQDGLPPGRRRPIASPSVASPMQPGGYVRLSVTDTGTGMTPDVLARVTEPFFTTKAQGKGTGLGLAMARGFAEQSGGGLAVESAPGRGTSVSLWLPASGRQAAPPPSGGARATQAEQDRRARVLLVDDDEIVREVTTEQLEGEGYTVVPSDSGAAALALVDAGERVDIVLSDLSMPGMDGLTVIREVQKRRRGLPAILLTGFATNAAELAVSGVVSGEFSLLRKPAMVRQIVERIEMLLGGAVVGCGD